MMSRLNYYYLVDKFPLLIVNLIFLTIFVINYYKFLKFIYNFNILIKF